MNRWGLFLFAGWAIVTLAVFLATVVGTMAEAYLSVSGNGTQVIQAIVTSGIILPMVIYLYKRLHQQSEQPEVPAFAFTKTPHFLTGFLFAVVLAIAGLYIMSMSGLIGSIQWQAVTTWLGALLVNLLIAFFYEALPEELIMRGFIFDVLRHKLSVWQTVLVQAFIFLAFSFGVTLLQVIVGIASTDSLILLAPELILHFFFAIALALMRVWTGSIWAAVGFHLGYLVIARFLLMPDIGGTPAVLTFQDNITQGAGASLAIMIVIFGTIILMLILNGVKRNLNKREN